MNDFYLWSAITIAVSVGAELLLMKRRKESFNFSTFVANSTRLALAALLIVLVIQTFVLVTAIYSETVGETDQDTLSAAEDSVRSLGGNNLFLKVASQRLDGLRGELGAIGGGELPLRNVDEVTSVWRELVKSAANSIKATNVISPTFWETAKNMGEDARSAHRAARASGVRISRLHILTSEEPANLLAVTKLAEEYAELGVVNKFVRLRDLEALDGYSDCQTKLSAIDFVVYDESVVLLVTHSTALDVLSGRLSRRRAEHVDVAARCFDSWWDSNAASTSAPVPGSEPS